jgi:hypothetical protein
MGTVITDAYRAQPVRSDPVVGVNALETVSNRT